MRMRALVAGVLALFCADLAIAQSDGLRRLSDRDDLLGWEAVGRLDTAQGGFCTATLIASDLVLTAAHCVFDGMRLRQPGELTFRAGLRDGVAIAQRDVVAFAVPDAYQRQAGMSMDNVPHDVALLRLSTPITSTDADPFILHQGAVEGSEISVTSYAEGRAEALSRQRSCRIVAQQPPLMAFDCNVSFGSSGAPVFVSNGTRGRIVSIISGGVRLDGTLVSVGMALPDVVAGLKADLRRQGASPSSPGVRRLGAGDGRASSGAKFVRPGGS